MKKSGQVLFNSSVLAWSQLPAPVVKHVVRTDWLTAGCVGASADTHFHLSAQTHCSPCAGCPLLANGRCPSTHISSLTFFSIKKKKKNLRNTHWHGLVRFRRLPASAQWGISSFCPTCGALFTSLYQYWGILATTLKNVRCFCIFFFPLGLTGV